MRPEDSDHGSFAEIVRSIVREATQAAQERAEQADLENLAGAFGLDPGRARAWVDGAAQWLRDQAENLGDEIPFPRASPFRREAAPDSLDNVPTHHPPDSGKTHPLGSAEPHPLDLPTDEQGLALAALSSGRWTVEPGADALASRGSGPGPSDALGLARELRARDWISADGEVTPVGAHALGRWLAAAQPR